jgi:hypothetical protein
MATQTAQLDEVMRRLEGSAVAPPPSLPPSAPSGFTPAAAFTPGSISATSFGEGPSSLQNLGSSVQAQPSVLGAGAVEDLPPHDLLMSL